jgi:uncharacterized protein HemX
MENAQDLRSENQLLKKSAKTYKVILLVLFVLLLCSSVFAYVQRSEAQLQKMLSEKLKSNAEEAQKLAAINAEHAFQAEQLCHTKLIECEQRSK